MALINKKSKDTKEDTKLNISVCIITHNDEELIEDCIKSIQDLVREIIVVDIGSTDSTVDIVRNYTNRIYWHKWNNDYSEIRNFFAKYVSSEWVLHMEANERLTPESKKYLNPKLLDRKNVAYICKTTYMYQDKETEGYACKIFRRNADIKFKYVLDSTAADDIQKVGRRENLDIIRTDIVFNQYLYLKYFDESELHEERIELAKHGLEDKKISPVIRTYYKLCLGLSLNSLGEADEADDILNEVLEDLRGMDKMAVYNIPTFMQTYLYFAFKYAKKEKYDEGIEIMKEGIEIYHNSLTMLLRYIEFLAAKQMYKECDTYLKKMKDLVSEESYYVMETLDTALIDRLFRKLDNLTKERLDKGFATAEQS